MHVYLPNPIEYAGRNVGPGVISCTHGGFQALAFRGEVRPATADEVQAAAQPVPELEPAEGAAPEVERADASPDTEAGARRPRAGRRVLAHA